ncbi:MAG TPA: class I SAM-dependent methyltransferase [Spirochaetota bacterium]|nr:class I SAM-dependent methyltransferase [Spirochaetota bacterium]
MKTGGINSLIKAAFEKRIKLFSDPETDCFRIFNSSGDGLEGFTADWYSGYILVQYFRGSVEAGIAAILDQVKSCSGGLPATVKGILVKNRMAMPESEGTEKWKSRLLHGSYPEEGIIVRQNGIMMNADLVNGQNTGIFLDMRGIRTELAGFYKREKPVSMLNLFCYTGAFSVHALRSGVQRAVNVDLSKSVLNKARDNYRLNGLGVDERDFIYGDSYERVKIFAKKNIHFDYAVFDPPTFSRNRGKNFSVRQDYTAFLELLGTVVPGGFIFTSINAAAVSKSDYLSFHPGRWELVMFANESSDFIHRGNPYLKAGLWKI